MSLYRHVGGDLLGLGVGRRGGELQLLHYFDGELGEALVLVGVVLLGGALEFHGRFEAFSRLSTSNGVEVVSWPFQELLLLQHRK